MAAVQWQPTALLGESLEHGLPNQLSINECLGPTQQAKLKGLTGKQHGSSPGKEHQTNTKNTVTTLCCTSAKLGRHLGNVVTADVLKMLCFGSCVFIFFPSFFIEHVLFFRLAKSWSAWLWMSVLGEVSDIRLSHLARLAFRLALSVSVRSPWPWTGSAMNGLKTPDRPWCCSKGTPGCLVSHVLAVTWTGAGAICCLMSWF